MLPKRRVWKEEPTFPNEFSKHFSTIRSPKSSTHALEKVLRNLRLILSSFVTSLCSPNQPSATSPLFFDNLHFEHFDKSVNHESRLTLLSKCSKWRLSKNRGLVADGCPKRRFWRAEQTFGNVFSKHFSNERSPNRVLTYVTKHFSNERSPNRVLTYVKSALKIRSRMFVRPSKIFVWGS